MPNLLDVLSSKLRREEELRLASERVARQEKEMKRLQSWIEDFKGQATGADGSRTARSENMVWIFDTGRSGSMWLGA